MPKDRQQVEYEAFGKGIAESKAAETNKAVGLAANSKINKGLGDLIEKTGKAAPDVAAAGEPQRSAFPAGLVGQSEYNRALTAWKNKSAKPVATPKALGGAR